MDRARILKKGSTKARDRYGSRGIILLYYINLDLSTSSRVRSRMYVRMY